MCALSPRLVDLSRAVRYQGVDLDSCLLEERAGRILIPDDPEPEPTPAPALPPPAPPTGLSTLTPGPLTVGHTLSHTVTQTHTHIYADTLTRSV